MVVAVLGWAWHRFSAPAPPRLSLEGLSPAMARVVNEALEGVQRDRRSSEAWGRLGMVLAVYSLAPEAEQCLAQAASLAPDEPRWPYLLGVQIAGADREKALPYLRHAVELVARADRFNTAPRLRLAETLVQLDQAGEAKEHYLKVLRAQPDNARAHYGLGLVALAQDDPRTAEECFTWAAQSPLARRKANAQLARLAQGRGSKDAAEFARLATQLPKDLAWPDPYVEESLQSASFARP
jgi:tetratricopeptide (TPR) repeat protein